MHGAPDRVQTSENLTYKQQSSVSTTRIEARDSCGTPPTSEDWTHMLDQPSDLTWYAYRTLGVVVHAVAVWSNMEMVESSAVAPPH
jgi:hypothetical protein